MKRLVLAVLGLSALIAVGFYVNRPAAPAIQPPETPTESVTEPTPVQTVEHPQRVRAIPAAPEQASQIPADSGSPPPVSHTPAKPPSARLVFNQAIETLVSPQATYEQRQAVLKQLKDTGKLDDAISALEQKVADDPRSVESVTALGQVYYKKAGQTEDVRERAILAMKADQSLEAALNLDSSNWDARFTKANGMSHWPAELNKGKEVFEQFQQLIQQQEAETPQPQFARTYLRLGEQYEKAGYPKYAAEVWQRGAALFPADSDLKAKLAAMSQSQ